MNTEPQRAQRRREAAGLQSCDAGDAADAAAPEGASRCARREGHSGECGEEGQPRNNAATHQHAGQRHERLLPACGVQDQCSTAGDALGGKQCHAGTGQLDPRLEDRVAFGGRPEYSHGSERDQAIGHLQHDEQGERDASDPHAAHSAWQLPSRRPARLGGLTLNGA